MKDWEARTAGQTSHFAALFGFAEDLNIALVSASNVQSAVDLAEALADHATVALGFIDSDLATSGRR